MRDIRSLLLIVLCLSLSSSWAEDGGKKDYPGANVVAQEIENHRLMLKSLQDLQKSSEVSGQNRQQSFDELINYLNAALISFEYLDSLWAGKTGESYKANESEMMSANLPCACNGEGMLSAS